MRMHTEKPFTAPREALHGPAAAVAQTTLASGRLVCSTLPFRKTPTLAGGMRATVVQCAWV